MKTKNKYPEYIKDKIYSVNDLCLKLKKDLKGKIIALCHGTFDIVHPGHIRHLLFAKQKADILIVSVTADKYVFKKQDGPYIPEELRTRNLASLTMVDYVIIDYNQKPLKLISKIKPNYFVKGFEYSLDKIHPSTREEIKVLKKNKGEVLFSPGDVVYSSTKLQALKKPKINLEKLNAIMDSENVSVDDLIAAINKFKSTSIHIVGDIIVDKYNYCSILGQTSKTPTFSVKKISEETFVGGAGIVAKHLKSLGANVTITSIIGDDKLGKYVIKDLRKHNIKTNLIVDKNRPTTLKERFWADNYKLIQVDLVDNNVPSEKIINQIKQKIIKTKSKAIVFSDFRHGVFNKESIKLFSKCINKSTIKIADSQVSNRWGNISEFENFDLILPNEKEARFSLGDQDSGVRQLGTKLYKKTKPKYLILKLGEKGLMAFRKSAEHPRDFFPIDSFVENLIDAVGAGDALLSAASLSFANTKNIFISSVLGNIAAAISCENLGNNLITLRQIKERLKKLSD